jgi:oxygen-independent coproporphyrinogen-3 oxidase
MEMNAAESSPRLEVDLDLLKKYNRPGPRYTSYPTAPHFHEGFGPEEYRQEILSTNAGEPPRDLSLYFHFPFCKSLCYFCACNVVITKDASRVGHYLGVLKKEIDLVANLVDSRRQVVQMHWGGGTPTYMSPDQIRDIFGYIRDKFPFAAEAEISIEIDPRTISPEHLPALREAGFNRVSFGLQDLNPEVQTTINRIQTDEQNAFVINESRRLGFDSINVDLIYGLPHQSVESYERTLEKIIAWDPDRLAVFNYAHVPWLKKHQKLLPVEAMPDAADRLRMLKLIIDRLTEVGYAYIGMDHFAKPGDELTKALRERTLHRNFQGYSTRAEADMFAMGVTSISKLAGAYAQNLKSLAAYEAALNEGRLPTAIGLKFSHDDLLRQHVITEIMCNNRILKHDVEQKFGITFDSYFADVPEKLNEFVLDGLVSLQPDRIEVSEAGRLVIRNIAMAFDAYLKPEASQEKPIYSRTV